MSIIGVIPLISVYSDSLFGLRSGIIPLQTSFPSLRCFLADFLALHRMLVMLFAALF